MNLAKSLMIGDLAHGIRALRVFKGKDGRFLLTRKSRADLLKLERAIKTCNVQFVHSVWVDGQGQPLYYAVERKRGKR